jgi:putative DNA primase/helicase
MIIYGYEMPLQACIKNTLGIEVELNTDGQFYRYPAPDKATTNKACWLRVSECGRLAFFGNFITGESHSWFADSDSETNYPEYESTEVQLPLALDNRDEAQNAAASIAITMLAEAQPARPGSHYVSMKRISPKGLKLSGFALLIPIQNIQGVIRNIQTIHPDCSKYFLKGGEIKGNFAVCGELFSTEKLFICEGYATAATIHEITGECTVAAMNAGNLMAVAQEIAANAPAGIEIIIAADNDHMTAGNPGITKGTAAAEAIGAKIVYPEVPCSYLLCKCTDFNDWEHCYYRTEEV